MLPNKLFMIKLGEMDKYGLYIDFVESSLYEYCCFGISTFKGPKILLSCSTWNIFLFFLLSMWTLCKKNRGESIRGLIYCFLMIKNLHVLKTWEGRGKYKELCLTKEVNKKKEIGFKDDLGHAWFQQQKHMI